MFKQFLKKIKEQCSKIHCPVIKNRKTPTNSKSKDFFISRWGINESGLANLDNKEPKDFVTALSCLVDEIMFGTVFEPHYDSKKHKRYYEHPACNISGFVAFSTNFYLDQCPSDMPHGLILSYECGGEHITLGTFNLLQYVDFTHFCPTLSTMRLAYDIFESIGQFVNETSKEDVRFGILQETYDEFSVDTEEKVFLLSYLNCQNSYKLYPLGEDWDAHAILNTVVENAPKETTIKIDWNNQRFITLREDGVLIPVVPVVPMKENGDGSFNPIALLSPDLATMVGDLL